MVALCSFYTLRSENNGILQYYTLRLGSEVPQPLRTAFKK